GRPPAAFCQPLNGRCTGKGDSFKPPYSRARKLAGAVPGSRKPGATCGVAAQTREASAEDCDSSDLSVGSTRAHGDADAARLKGEFTFGFGSAPMKSVVWAVLVLMAAFVTSPLEAAAQTRADLEMRQLDVAGQSRSFGIYQPQR